MALFSNKVAIVTGGTQGIGRATAVAFAKEGAKVVVAGRGVEAGQETVRLAKLAGGEGIFARTDVSREADVKQMVETALKNFGRLDVACNNAGVDQDFLPLIQQSEEMFDRVMNTNVKGVWLSMKHEIPAMLASGGGAIVNMSSIFGCVAMPNVELYVASKHAVLGLTKSSALEFAKSNIRINAVAPGAVQTDMIDRLAAGDTETLNYFASLHPLGRIAISEEIAEAVIWLCSEKAAFVTGHTLVVDGGYTAQ